MEIVLISGFWLNGASWDDVAVPLRNAGHAVDRVTGVPAARSPSN